MEIYYNVRSSTFYIIKREKDGISIRYEDELTVEEVLKIIREGAPDELNTFVELIAEINKKVDKVDGMNLSSNDFTNAYKTLIDGLAILINTKVDKIQGKGLSTNDFTNEDKERLYNISVSSNYYFDEPYIGSDIPGSGSNILLHGKSRIWNDLLTNKIFLITNLYNKYYSVELTE